MTTKLRIGALISGGGRTLLNIADHVDAGTLAAQIAVVISSRADAAGVARARERGFDVRIADRVTFPDSADLDRAIMTWLAEARVDLVCACGYLRLLRIAPMFEGRVMNIHPALLPDFGGKGMHGEHVHRAVLASGRPFSGCTVHFADHRYDHGPVILQRTCPVLATDDVKTLAARVFEQECIAYPQAIRLFAEGRLVVREGRVEVRPAAEEAEALRSRRTEAPQDQ